ncbi:hypothetical protein OB905_09560 [Halobacteria archaeon AArc-dxtr1]|nr:hypothetical protein [Halobacteria archaeon AArc-dxtr1]
MGYEWGTQLFRSPHRRTLLRELRSEPGDTQALVERVSVSRVTVQRHLHQCSELGWVQKVDGRYELTPVGEFVCEATTAFVDRLSVLEAHGDIIDELAAIDDEFDPLLLEDVTVSVANETNPHEPLSHYRNSILEESTETVRGISPVFSELFVETHEQLLAAGVETELITPRSVLEVAPTPMEAIPTSLFTIFALDQPIEFGMTVTDETAFVGVYDEGVFVACIESQEPAFYEWAVDAYESYREQATRVPLEESAAGDGN